MLHRKEMSMCFEEFIEQSQHIECQYKVTEDIYKAFQVVSGDMNPLHVDKEFAQSKGMQDKVMYGNILNAFISHFVGMCLPSSDVMILAQDINYHLPVYMNDELLLDVKIEDASDSVRVVNYKFVMYKLTGEDKKPKVAKGHVQIKMI